jgi:structural maintenance of chromosome 4
MVQEDAPDGFTVISNSEVVVSRTAMKDNTSIYKYNGKRMVFKELATELRKLGIDLDHNRFLILQVCLPSIFQG